MCLPEFVRVVQNVLTFSSTQRNWSIASSVYKWAYAWFKHDTVRTDGSYMKLQDSWGRGWGLAAGRGVEVWAVTGDMSGTGRGGRESIRQPQTVVTAKMRSCAGYTTVTRSHIHTHTHTLSKLHLLIPPVFSFSSLPHTYYFISIGLFNWLSHSFTSCFWQHRLSHSHTLITHWSDSALQTKINSSHSQRRCPSGKSVQALFTWINSF